MIHQNPDPEIGKAQWLRGLDVFVLGPAMIYAGATGRIPDWMKAGAIIGGIFTIIWNAENYARISRGR